jgi:hypothetical protein
MPTFKRKSHTKQPDLHLGPLPVDAINRTLGTNYAFGEVIFTRAAQVHAASRHPDEYPSCLPHVGAVIRYPLYIGDDLKNHGKIELIARIPQIRGGLLVAINMERQSTGAYHVCSMYRVDEAKIQKRRDKGFLKVAQ